MEQYIQFRILKFPLTLSLDKHVVDTIDTIGLGESSECHALENLRIFFLEDSHFRTPSKNQMLYGAIGHLPNLQSTLWFHQR